MLIATFIVFICIAVGDPEPPWSWLYGSWIYNCLSNQCLLPLNFWFRFLSKSWVTKLCRSLLCCCPGFFNNNFNTNPPSEYNNLLHTYNIASGQAKDYTIGICCVSAKSTTLRSKSKDWLARNQNNVPERSKMSTRGLLVQWASSMEILIISSNY
jgi:hypothetical protein